MYRDFLGIGFLDTSLLEKRLLSVTVAADHKQLQSPGIRRHAYAYVASRPVGARP